MSQSIDALLASLDAETRIHLRSLENLDERLNEVFSEAHKVWPEFGIGCTAFFLHLSLHLPQGQACVPALKSLCSSDLYLALACAQGNARAIECLESNYRADLDRVYDDVDSTVLDRDDFRQVVWERVLLFPSGGQAKIASYRGQGRLSAWLRMTARRALLNAIRDAKRRPDEANHDRLLSQMLSESDDARLALDKAQHRAWFKEAFSDALATLEPHERNLLRYRFVEGLSIQDSARILGMHRVSTSRQLGRIRLQLQAEVRRGFVRRAGSQEALAELLSNLELSLSRVLK